MTRHSFLHIYKPILLLALDEYGRNPTVATLATLFASVNSMDLADMPRLSSIERLMLLSSDREDLFGDMYDTSYRSRSVSNSSQVSQVSDRMSDLLISPSFLSIPSPSMQIVRDPHHHSSSILYNGTVIPIKVPLTVLPEIVGDFSLMQLISVFSKPGIVNSWPLHPDLTTNGPSTPPILVLMNALISQKRVVFLGRGRPSGEVAGNVLAACAMASGGTGLLRGFTQRAFPYTDLSKIDDLLTIDGFIAGVTNSVFELHPEWWDLLCNTETGQITISSQIRPAERIPVEASSYLLNLVENKSPTSPNELSDSAFVENILHLITNKASETTIRLRFRDFVHRFIRVAGSYEQAVYGSSELLPPESQTFHLPGCGWLWPDEASKKRDFLALATRIEAWRGTDSYRNCIIDVKAQYSRSSPRVRTLDLWYQVERLRRVRDMTIEESARVYKVLKEEIIVDSHIMELLSLCPSSVGGLTFLGQGLFHPDAEARKSAVYLIEKIKDHATGKHFYASMMRYHRTTFQRLSDELDRASIDENDVLSN